MRPMRITLMIALLATSLIAGCLGGDDTNINGDNDDDPQVGDDTGSLQGRVIRDDLSQVADARVHLVKDDQLVAETTSADDGSYRINNVEPGDYRLQTTAACCRESASGITIVAGEMITQDLMLTPFTSADLKEPHVIVDDWTGFISCGVAVEGGAGLAACGLADPSDDFMLEFTVPENMKTFSVGMTWDPVGGVSGQEFALLIENDDCDGLECSYRYGEPEGGPDLIAHINNDDITEDEWKWDNINGQRGLQFRIFTGGTGVVYQQPFTIHYHMHIFEEAPSDYNPIPDI